MALYQKIHEEFYLCGKFRAFMKKCTIWPILSVALSEQQRSRSSRCRCSNSRCSNSRCSNSRCSNSSSSIKATTAAASRQQLHQGNNNKTDDIKSNHSPFIRNSLASACAVAFKLAFSHVCNHIVQHESIVESPRETHTQVVVG